MPRQKKDATLAAQPQVTGFDCFFHQYREEHLRQHPNSNVDHSEFMKLCSRKWKSMSDAEKLLYEQYANGNNKRYLEKEAYHPPAKKVKKVKDPNAPKRYMSAFFWFSNDERAKVKLENPDAGIGGIAKVLGHMWKEITPELKNKYVEMAARDKARYEKEMEDYKAGGSYGKDASD